MNKVMFSIILPVYNAELYLKECIESVLNQRFGSWELILIDDGSTDNSKKIYDMYAKNEKIKINKKDNSGVSAARNLGIDKSSGEYIVFLDADDILKNNALRRVASVLEFEPDLVCFDYNALSAKGIVQARKSTKVGDYKSKEDIDSIIEFSIRQSQWYGSDWYGNMRPVWSKCFKAKVLKDNGVRFKEGLKYGEDMSFVLSVLIHCKHVKITPKSFYIYRDNTTSVMHNRLWTNSNQGILYFNTARQSVDGRIGEVAFRDLWLETAESDWMLINLNKMSYKKKRAIFSKLMKSDLYQWYSKGKRNSYASRKQYVYSLCIRFHLIDLLMFLSKCRANLHKNREVKY